MAGKDCKNISLLGFLAAKTLPATGAKHGLCVFCYLFGRFPIVIIDPILVVLALVGRVGATDLGASFVDTAEAVGLQVLARRVDYQIPVATLNKNARPLVQQEPSHVVKVAPSGWLVHRQGKVAAAFRCAKRTQTLTGIEILSARFAAFQLRWVKNVECDCGHT